MKRIMVLGVAIAAMAIAVVPAEAAAPVPYPASKVADLFVAAQTVNTSGVMASWFTPGSDIVFRAYAVDPKTKKVVDPKTVRYFYVTIPGQPNVKLKYDACGSGRVEGHALVGRLVGAGFVPVGVCGTQGARAGEGQEREADAGAIRPDPRRVGDA